MARDRKKGATLYICPQASKCRGGCYHYYPHRYRTKKYDACDMVCVSNMHLREGATDTTCRAIPDGEAVMYALKKLAEGEKIE